MARATQRTDAPKEDTGTAAPRTAVLVFHGIGDQRPMETMLGVVDAVLGPPATDEEAARRQGSIPRWIKPYVGKDGSFDLKSVTTPPIGVSEKRRYDFFELYWAHLMSGTRFVACCCGSAISPSATGRVSPRMRAGSGPLPSSSSPPRCSPWSTSSGSSAPGSSDCPCRILRRVPIMPRFRRPAPSWRSVSSRRSSRSEVLERAGPWPV